MEIKVNERWETKTKGWEEKIDGPGVFQYHFICRNCGGALPQGFVVAPRFCPYCGKEHG